METTTVSKKMIDASSFDLNLLTVFCLVYTTGRVASAAQILNISPSAVSQSLKKLRTKFNDHLFIRNGNSLLPTLFATELYQVANDIVMKVGRFLSKDSEAVKTKIVIGTSLTLSLLIIPDLTKMMLSKFPDCSLLHYEETASDTQIKERLSLRQADIIFSPSKIETSSLTSKKVFDMNFVLVSGSNDNKKITLTELQQADLVSMNGTGDLFIYYSHEIQRSYNLKPRRLMTSCLESMVALIATSDFMGVIPDKLFALYKDKYPVYAIEHEIKIPGINVYMTYRKELDQDESLCSMLGDIHTLFAK